MQKNKLIRRGIMLSSVMMLLLSTEPVFAASGINAQEQRLLDEADTQAKRLNMQENAQFQKYRAQGRNWLMMDDIDLEKEQVDSILQKLEALMPKIEAVIKGTANKETEEKKTSDGGRNKTEELLYIIREAAGTAAPILGENNIVISQDLVNMEGGLKAQIVNKNEDGTIKSVKTILSTEDVIKNTGINMKVPFTMAKAALLILAVGTLAGIKWCREADE